MTVLLAIVETVGVVGGLGASWRLAWVRGRASGRLARLLRPCSCEHGFGGHGSDGCRMRVEIVHWREEPVTPQAATLRKIRWSEWGPCGCRRFDGEIPPDAYAPQPG